MLHLPQDSVVLRFLEFFFFFFNAEEVEHVKYQAGGPIVSAVA